MHPGSMWIVKNVKKHSLISGKATSARLAIRMPVVKFRSLPSGTEPQLPFFIKCGRDTDDLQEASKLTPWRQPALPSPTPARPPYLSSWNFLSQEAPGEPFTRLLLLPLLKGPVGPVMQQKGPQWLSSRGPSPPLRTLLQL